MIGKRLTFWLKKIHTTLVVIGLVALIYNLSTNSSVDITSNWGFLVGAGFLVSQISFYIYSWRFRRVASLMDIQLSAVESLRLNMQGLFYHFFLPFSAGGDFAKFFKLKMHQTSKQVRLRAIILDHSVGVFSLLLIATFLLSYKEHPFEYPQMNYLISAGICFTILAIIMVWKKYFVSIKKFIITNMPEIVTIFVSSVVMQTLLSLAIWLGSLDLGMDISYMDVFFVMSLSMIFNAVPAHFLGIGLTEIMGSALYISIGLSPIEAIQMVSFLYIFRLTIAVMGGGWEFLDQTLTRH
ncbi:MAG: flippase-like domain-containing protein [Proteobacteria bacterium]|jgi:uncharacterized membrane protein YbhN (UPF0104 family)|nr:flippase-like domain-containing protein [Pseudomonadota bacterium]MBT5066279.1 flippase-like domain-containing protein [Pseudomonadota bacterium]MBT6192112.1 flippase-like domain-containing protein [Pseudomonadota bacterium]MBT6464423.1 flippase-like domain-containing protein [Pseudomonadota bacterium]MBT7247314.1 flippase-like domain-containing protein [Pseudomonadota bacterium]